MIDRTKPQMVKKIEKLILNPLNHLQKNTDESIDKIREIAALFR